MSLIRSVKHFVIVGDGRVGKTTLLFTYTNGFYQESTVPTIYDREETSVRFNGEDYPVQFHDTAGQEDYESASRFAYSVADVIILCYAVPERISFENIELKWIPKIIKARPNVPIVLVGTKHDVKTPNFVSVREATKTANSANSVPVKLSLRMGEIGDFKHIVLVGDGQVGKTSLVYAFKNGYFTESYIPTM
ncbi:ras-like GTP-binding protein RhoL [Phlebotomus argentipes]|uniref:ras-like GTP-binding protein RhoL n=1 Tax=Phlebotomus argentipes TaxID=94469 RepID=UPI002893210F|nr:ras-like GTP-binding protein RhoL [Phlebotomus argentipes]